MRVIRVQCVNRWSRTVVQDSFNACRLNEVGTSLPPFSTVTDDVEVISLLCATIVAVVSASASSALSALFGSTVGSDFRLLRVCGTISSSVSWIWIVLTGIFVGVDDVEDALGFSGFNTAVLGNENRSGIVSRNEIVIFRRPIDGLHISSMESRDNCAQ